MVPPGGGPRLRPSELACPPPTTDETSKKIAHAKAVAAEAQATAARVQARVQDMQQSAARWQGQYGGLRSQDLDQAVLDAGRSGGPLGSSAPDGGEGALWGT